MDMQESELSGAAPSAPAPIGPMLSGIRLIEVAALGPAPFCGMMLADHGADVVLVEREKPDPDSTDFGEHALINRGKRSIALDLKSGRGQEIFLDLVRSADALIEGFRPGVMECLGLGPAQCQAVNPRLVYGRATGWGQTGPMSQMAGHDHNYIALSGAMWYSGLAGTPPFSAPSMLGDVAGGALYLAFGVLAGVLKARECGRGCVVDAAVCDGSAHMMSLIHLLLRHGAIGMPRGTSLLDGSHWSRTYECACGGFVSIQCFEPKFYRVFLERLGLAGNELLAEQFDPKRWPEQSTFLQHVFRSRRREEWDRVFMGTDACYAPVLSPDEAVLHAHNRARRNFVQVEGELQAAPAPRFSLSHEWQPRPSPARGEHTAQILQSLGYPVNPGTPGPRS